MNLEALQKAMIDLKGSSFKLWCYFNKNQDNYQFELSQKACSEWGIKKDSYYSAVKDLTEKGYLMPLSPHSNIFYFYEIPLSENTIYFSENENAASEIQIISSENTERNNTNNTFIKHNKTKVFNKYGREIKKTNLEIYNALDEECIHNRDEYLNETVDELLNPGFYWGDPRVRLEEMTTEEYEMMYDLYREYVLKL